MDDRYPWEKFSAKEWSLALQSCTPGGSEFVTPAECVAHIKERTRYPRIILEQRDTILALENRVKELEAQLGAALLRERFKAGQLANR